MYGSESYLSPEPILNGLGFEMGECINCCCLCMMIVVSHEICHHNHHDNKLLPYVPHDISLDQVFFNTTAATLSAIIPARNILTER